MKLSSEAFLSSWVEKYNSSLYIFRFPNVVGSPATHGVIFDFMFGGLHIMNVNHERTIN